METLYDGDTFELNGLTFRVKFESDYYSGAPWERCDGHGAVRKSYQRHRDGESDKKPGERPLNQAGHRDRQFYYDWAAACKDARRDGWNAEPYDAPNRIARAVEADFQFLSAFINNDWHYVGVIVELLDDDGEVLSDTSLWGVETWKDNHCEVAHDLARELSAQHDAEQEQTAVESFEAHYWATRDVVTLGAGV
ncbi:MAG: hypothetical protein ACK5X3_10835 [Pseudomonadota bacterium]|jgi:hypothetical protein